MKQIAIGLVVGLLVFATVMWIGWMHGLDFSECNKWTGATAMLAVLTGVFGGCFAAYVSEDVE